MRRVITLLFLLPALYWLAPDVSRADVELKGAGASSAKTLLAGWAELSIGWTPPLRLKYDSVDSRGGIDRWLGKGVDFAVMDNPILGEEERKAASNVLHLPLGLDAVAVVYNVPGVPSGVRLSPRVLSLIYKGAVHKWNDPFITQPNPEFSFPDMEILVVRREDQSTFYDLFPRFLSETDPAWVPGQTGAKKIKWPVGVNAKGNEKTLERLRKTAGALGTLDFSFAARNHLPLAEIQNVAGNYVAPANESIQASTLDWVNLPSDLKVSIIRPRNGKAYPLSSFLWFLAPKDDAKFRRNPRRTEALVEFLQWALEDGQEKLGELAYTPLPGQFVPLVKEKIASIHIGK